MKKNLRKVLAAVLSVIMAAACFAPMALAATPETVTKYGEAGGYLAIGDSISRGCGTDGFYKDRNGVVYGGQGGQYDLYDMRNVEGALPCQIAQIVGCTAPMDMADQNATYWPFCYPGMTVGVTMDLLGIEDDFTDTALDYPYYGDMLEFFGYEGSFDGVRESDKYVEGECGKCGNIIELIKNTDLITLQLGMCDVFYRAYRIATKGGFLADGWSAAMENVDDLLGVVKTAIGEMYNGFEYFEKTYPVLLKYIRELNPDATIVVVGAFNVVNELTITDDMIMPIGSVVSLLTDKMNKDYEKWAKEYDAIYCDVSNIEVLAAEKDWSLMGDFIDNTFIGTHPSQLGYDQMVRQVIAVLPDDQAKPEGIVVDLGRYTKVDKVLLNGTETKDYELNGYVLTVHNPGLLAFNLTVEIVNEDGTTALQIYTVDRQADGSYVAHRSYGSNDIDSQLMKPINLVLNLLKQLFDKIVDFFKGLFN